MKKIFSAILALASFTYAAEITFENLQNDATISGYTNTNGVIAPEGENYFFISYATETDWMASQNVAAIAFTLDTNAIKNISDSAVICSVSGNYRAYNPETGKTLSYTFGDIKSQLSENSSAFCILLRSTTATLFSENGDSLTLSTRVPDSFFRTTQYTLSSSLVYSATILTNQGGAEAYDDYYGPYYPGDSTLAATLISKTPAGTYGENVPEPTTATLSLLALAGLAARRRRA